MVRGKNQCGVEEYPCFVESGGGGGGTGFSYFFEKSQQEYVKYDSGTAKVVSGYPLPYGTNQFPGIPASLNAAVPHYNDGSSIYFFQGSQYWKYSITDGSVLPGYPLTYGTGTGFWPGVPASPDAALSHPSDGRSVYFFKGSQYWKYDMVTAALVPGYPQTYGTGTGNWPGVPSNLDAAISHWSDGTSAYFFKGSQYWKYSIGTGSLYAGYPKAYGAGTGNFEGVPAGLSAGVNRCGASGPVQFGAGC
jgi:hypothetical protein